MKAVSLLSGGLDSVTLAYWLREQEYELTCLSFDYGQRHRKEILVAQSIARQIGADHAVIELSHVKPHALVTIDNVQRFASSDRFPLASLLGGSSLTDLAITVPDGHYAEESMKVTVVPNRNAIMLSIAYGIAIARGAEIVGFAAHSGDHAIYPDCRPEFVGALNFALTSGNVWADPTPNIIAPFLSKTKAEIVQEGSMLGVPFEQTWSCYKGGSIHCGTCGTCYERREAFKLAGVDDPTEYLDSTTEFDAPESVELPGGSTEG